MRKLMLIAGLCLLSATAFAAPSDDEVAASLEGVFAVYGAVFMSYMMEVLPPQVEMTLDLQNGSSELSMENVDVAVLFSTIGESLDGSGDMPIIPFTGISGSLSTSAEGDMNMNVILDGGQVKSIQLDIIAGEMAELIADGRSYMHMEDVFDYSP